jgi:hypothetical protein
VDCLKTAASNASNYCSAPAETCQKYSLLLLRCLLQQHLTESFCDIFVHLFSNKMKLGLALKLGLIGTALVSVSPRSTLARTAKANLILASRSVSSDAAQFAKSSYDYIVVGGGTAGLTVAARLSENGRYTVGVLEAGGSGFGDPIVDIPGEFGADLGTKYDCE